MTKSALQIARAAYQPKVPAALKGAVKAVDGEYTQSVADQEAVEQLSFPDRRNSSFHNAIAGKTE